LAIWPSFHLAWTYR